MLKAEFRRFRVIDDIEMEQTRSLTMPTNRLPRGVVRTLETTRIVRFRAGETINLRRFPDFVMWDGASRVMYVYVPYRFGFTESLIQMKLAEGSFIEVKTPVDA